MTRDDVKRGVEAVILKSWDPKEATRLENELYRRVLQGIASGADEPQALAEEAIRTRGLQFKRAEAA